MQTPSAAPSEHKASLAALSLGALGVVYGDIGTSPLYAFQTAFSPDHGVPYSPHNILGVLSLIFWALTLIVLVKYVLLVLRADNDGEGGILALMALVMRRYAKGTRGRSIAIALGLIGASMFYGDSIITPAISVLSAVEGLGVATPVFNDWIVPITAGILVGLFVVQKHGTAAENQGQIYVPFINWLLMIFVLLLVLSFKTAENLAAAYGIAVNITMIVTTAFIWMIAQHRWGWSALRANLVFGGFALIDLAFLASNALKIDHGGWFPLLFGAAVYTLLATWKRGRTLLRRQLEEHALNLQDFVSSLSTYPPTRVEGTAIYLTPSSTTVPHALLHNLKHNKVLHERVIFLSAQTMDVPHVPPEQGVKLTPLEEGIYLLHVELGFQDEPDVQRILKEVERLYGMEFQLMETSFFLARQTIIPSKLPGMALWREVLFSWMSRNAQDASDYFRIPPNRVVELGTQVEI